MNGSPVNWLSKTQSIVATSTTESEYIALHSACMMLSSLTNILDFLGLPAEGVSEIRGDNVASLTMAESKCEG